MHKQNTAPQGAAQAFDQEQRKRGQVNTNTMAALLHWRSLLEPNVADTLLNAALAYAAAGLAVLPLNPRSKEPATKRSFYDATTNPVTIRRFWRVTDRNIGIATGAVSGFWVLDIDPGGEAIFVALKPSMANCR